MNRQPPKWGVQLVVKGLDVRLIDIVAFVNQARYYNQKMIQCRKAGVMSGVLGYQDLRNRSMQMARIYKNIYLQNRG